MLIDKIGGWIGKSDRRVIGKFLRQLQALCTYEHLVVPEAQRNEKLVDLTIVATWHVLDGIHRLSGHVAPCQSGAPAAPSRVVTLTRSGRPG